jgi:hypothetical protein
VSWRPALQRCQSGGADSRDHRLLQLEQKQHCLLDEGDVVDQSAQDRHGQA